MNDLEREFLKLVDEFVITSKDDDVLLEIKNLDIESRILGISFYDMYCIILQNVGGHQNLISKFNFFRQTRNHN